VVVDTAPKEAATIAANAIFFNAFINVNPQLLLF
jgi:hypothetical protein